MGDTYSLVSSNAVATLGSATFTPSSGSTTKYFKGLIGSLRLYKRALTVEEIGETYRCPVSSMTGMYAAFDFTSGGPGGIEDAIPNGAAQARWSGHAEFKGSPAAAKAASWEAVDLGPGHGLSLIHI